MKTIHIECGPISAREVRTELAELLHPDAGVVLAPRERSVISDPAVVVAMVSSGATSIAALVTALLTYANQRRAAMAVQKVVVKAKDGTTIEIPADLPEAEVAVWIQRAKALNVETVRLVLPP